MRRVFELLLRSGEKRYVDASEDDHVEGLEQWRRGADPKGVRTLEGDVVNPADVVHVRILERGPAPFDLPRVTTPFRKL
jgi:hypothetical protein